VVGDINDANSDAAKLLKKYKHFVLLPDEGTKPNVYYIREYSAR
jgi:Fe-S-cluster-containing dehydrogenase component